MKRGVFRIPLLLGRRRCCRLPFRGLLRSTTSVVYVVRSIVWTSTRLGAQLQCATASEQLHRFRDLQPARREEQSPMYSGKEE